MSSGAMQSNVGNPQTYEAGDQKDHKEGQPSRYDEGKPGAHSAFDSKDERSIANRLANAEPQNTTSDEEDKSKVDPTAAALSHGNEPSRGAKIDKEIMEDEEEELRKKDEAKAQSAAAHKK